MYPLSSALPLSLFQGSRLWYVCHASSDFTPTQSQHYRPVDYTPIKQDIEAVEGVEEGQTPLLAENELASPLTARFTIAGRLSQGNAEIRPPVTAYHRHAAETGVNPSP